jgi:hypothetical protein
MACGTHHHLPGGCGILTAVAIPALTASRIVLPWRLLPTVSSKVVMLRSIYLGECTVACVGMLHPFISSYSAVQVE